MNSRSQHVGKSRGEREYYLNALKRLHEDSTIQEDTIFSESTNFEKDFSNPTINSCRPQSFSDTISEHFKENWAGYAFSCIGIVVCYFLFTFIRDMGLVEGKLVGIEGDILKVEDMIEKFEEKLHETDLKIQKNSILLDQLEK